MDWWSSALCLKVGLTTDEFHALVELRFSGVGAVVVHPFEVLDIFSHDLGIAVVHVAGELGLHGQDLVYFLHLEEIHGLRVLFGQSELD